MEVRSQKLALGKAQAELKEKLLALRSHEAALAQTHELLEARCGELEERHQQELASLQVESGAW